MDGSTTDQLTMVPPEALGRLMPMYVWVSPTGHVREAGPTLLKLCGDCALIGRRFLETFELIRPRGVTTMAELGAVAGRRLHATLREPPHTAFRGLAVPLGPGQGMLVNLSFGIAVAEAVRDHDLTDADFAVTDLAVELLYLHEAKSAVMDELNGLNTRLQAARAAAEEQALTDPLTGLANRRALEMALTRAAEAADRDGPGFAMIHLDLDYFKSVNDTLGHAAGDHVLTQVAHILREETRRHDIVARVGGDEFVLILRGPADADRLVALARRIIARFEEPMEFEGQTCRISGSAGIVLSSGYERQNPDRMLSDADLALYASKRNGRAQATVYTPDLVLPDDHRTQD